MNEFRLALARLCGLKVRLRDGTTEIPWSDEFAPELGPAEGQEDFRSSTFSEGEITVWEREPGLYRLTVPEMPGYERVPDQTVRLERGELKEHVVELRRKR